MKAINRKILSISLIFLLFLFGGCSPAGRRGEPVRKRLELTPEQQFGKRVFMENCHRCHPGGNAGVGPALNDSNAPAFLIRFQVRNGLGRMPSFSENEIPDELLEYLVDYMMELRKHRK